MSVLTSIEFQHLADRLTFSLDYARFFGVFSLLIHFYSVHDHNIVLQCTSNEQSR